MRAREATKRTRRALDAHPHAPSPLRTVKLAPSARRSTCRDRRWPLMVASPHRSVDVGCRGRWRCCCYCCPTWFAAWPRAMLAQPHSGLRTSGICSATRR
jgi:hypothetical protein